MYSKYTNTDVENMLKEVKSLQKQLSELRPLNNDEIDIIYEDFSVRFTYDSNAIEGNTMTLDETFMLIKEGLTAMQKTASEQVESYAHHTLFMKLIKEVKTRKIISESIIKDIHKSLMGTTRPEIAGKYREINVGVGRTDDFYYAPDYDKVPTLMSQFVKDFSEIKNKSVIDYVDAHIKFEKIHPFADGNGRTGRMLLNFQLIKAGYLPVNVKFADRRDYIQAFKNITKTKDPTFMHGIVLNLEIEALKERIAMLK